MTTLDLNVDLGEGSPHEAQLMSLASSVNIACGGHTGDEDSLRNSLMLAKQNDVSIGAHPAYPDTQYFGRRVLDISSRSLTQSLVAQIAQCMAMAQEIGVQIDYVKPHGALYNHATQDTKHAQAIINALQECGLDTLYVLAGEHELSRLANQAGIKTIPEGFADRGYTPQGTLITRGQQGDLLSVNAAVSQAISLSKGWVETASGRIPLMIRTLCVHGDGKEALELLSQVRVALNEMNVSICSPFKHAKTEGA